MRRRLFTTTQYYADGHTRADLRWATHKQAITRVDRGVYAQGAAKPNTFEKALARMLASNTPPWGAVSGVLHGFDSVSVLDALPKRRQSTPVDDTLVTVDGVTCTSPLQTIVDLAETLDDLVWEQALESGLRHRRDPNDRRRRLPPLFDIADLAALLPTLAKSRRHGSTRIRRVLALRGLATPATESLLETLMVQLIRTLPGVPTPTRQYEVFNRHSVFVARVDLCWPDLGIFIELDGQQHEGQPVYDASRQTAVCAATGWVPGRFTWRQVRHNPIPTGRQVVDLVAQARRRPLLSVVGS
jgi:hypothetical protein